MNALTLKRGPAAPPASLIGAELLDHIAHLEHENALLKERIRNLQGMVALLTGKSNDPLDLEKRNHRRD